MRLALFCSSALLFNTSFNRRNLDSLICSCSQSVLMSYITWPLENFTVHAWETDIVLWGRQFWPCRSTARIVRIPSPPQVSKLRFENYHFSLSRGCFSQVLSTVTVLLLWHSGDTHDFCVSTALDLWPPVRSSTPARLWAGWRETLYFIHLYILRAEHSVWPP